MLVNFFWNQLLVASTLYLEMIQLLKRKDGFKETRVLDLFWKSRRPFSTSSLESKFVFHPWKKTILSLGSEFRLEPFVMWTIMLSTTLIILQVPMRRKQNQQAQKWLQPDQRQKQSLNQENLLARRPFHLVKEFGLILYHRGKITNHTRCRKEWSIFFGTIKMWIENEMEQFNFTKLNSWWGTILFQHKIGQTIDG